MRQHYSFMSKCFCAIFLAMIINIVSVKQALAQTQVAVLKHGDQISTFYGTTALSEAHEAAEAGDVITLSNGVFVLDTITKAVTIHGVGFVTDTVSGTAPTIVTTNVSANVHSGALTIEGVLFSKTFTATNLTNPRFLKCYFTNFTASDEVVSEPQFVHCRLVGISIPQCVNANFSNCVLWSINNEGSGMVATNSYIKLGSDIVVSGFNCIFYTITSSYNLQSQSTVVHCIGATNNILGSALQENCWTFGGCTQIFETFNGTPGNYLTEQLILKEEIANTCLGTDGTEVGIHGGTNPYNTRPYYLLIRHCTVGERTTDDGHLSVDIEVVTEE